MQFGSVEADVVVCDARDGGAAGEESIVLLDRIDNMVVNLPVDNTVVDLRFSYASPHGTFTRR